MGSLLFPEHLLVLVAILFTLYGSSVAENGDSKKKSAATIFIFIDIVGLVIVILLLILYCNKSRKLKKLIKTYRLDQEKDDFEDLGLEESGRSYYKESKDEISHTNIIIHADDDRDHDHDHDHEHYHDHEHDQEDQKTTLITNGEKEKLIFMGNNGAAAAGFDLSHLLRASAEGLGKGLFGNSYKAKLEGKSAVVVKRLRDLKPLSNDEFTNLLQMIADQKHPNLLPLLGYYYSKDEKLFLYRYANKGNLFNHLHEGRGTKDRIPFRWSSRLSVARSVARALEYLHLNANTSQHCPVPHGNLKLSNILLDDKDTVLVSDYCLTSIIALPIAAQRMVAYKSPEYQNSKRVSKKSDVWSYGSLLLELLTGRLSVHSSPPGINGVDLSSWVHRAVREEWTAEIFDMEISVQRSAAPGMLKLLQVAIRCSDKSPEKRPDMTEIVREIDSIKAVESDEEEELSADQSLTDESFSTNVSSVMVVGGGKSTNR